MSPFTYKNGMLIITAQPATPQQIATIPGLNSTRNFISGIITTFKSFSQTYGYFELWCTVPQAQGAWPAFWLLPLVKTPTNEWRLPEFDVFEFHQGTQANGINVTNQMIITLHDGVLGAEIDTSNLHSSPPVITPRAQHAYGLLWEPGLLTFYLDNKEVWSCTTTDTADPHYILINYAIDARYPTPAKDIFMITNVKAYSIPILPAMTGPEYDEEEDDDYQDAAA